MSTRTAARVDLVSSIVIGAFGLFTFVFGIWAMVDAASFYDNIAKFGQYNRHFLHDVGACLLFALAWRNDALLAVLGGAAVGATAHEIAHIWDNQLGGRDSDPWTLGIIAAVLVLTFVWRLRWKYVAPRG
jgi:hypothetical protein